MKRLRKLADGMSKTLRNSLTEIYARARRAFLDASDDTAVTASLNEIYGGVFARLQRRGVLPR